MVFEYGSAGWIFWSHLGRSSGLSWAHLFTRSHLWVRWTALEVLAGLSHILRGWWLLAIGWSGMTLTGMSGLSSTWSLILQQASLALFTWCRASKTASKSIKCLLRPRLRTDIPSLCHNQWAKASQSAQIQGWGNRFHFFTGRATKSHCQGHKLWERISEAIFFSQSTKNTNLECTGKPSISLVRFVKTPVSVFSLAKSGMCIPTPMKRTQMSGP